MNDYDHLQFLIARMARLEKGFANVRQLLNGRKQGIPLARVLNRIEQEVECIENEEWIIRGDEDSGKTGGDEK